MNPVSVGHVLCLTFVLINFQQRETRGHSLRAVYPASPTSRLCRPDIINRID